MQIYKRELSENIFPNSKVDIIDAFYFISLFKVKMFEI